MNIVKKAVLALLALAGASALAWSASGFHFLGPISRIITPMSGNPSKSNGTAFICYDNPNDIGVTGQVFTLLGREVAGMTDQPRTWTSTSCQNAYASYTPAFGGANAGTITWDGTSNGNVVRSGIYVY